MPLRLARWREASSHLAHGSSTVHRSLPLTLVLPRHLAPRPPFPIPSLPLPLPSPAGPIVAGTLMQTLFPHMAIYSVAATAVFYVPFWRHFIS